MRNRRNVGLFFNVYKEFFQEILTEKNELSEEHVNAYISIVASQPRMAGLKRVKRGVGITSTGFMVRKTQFLVRNKMFLTAANFLYD